LRFGGQVIGTKYWRKKNRVFQDDACALLSKLLQKNNDRPSIVYADPPYTADQYSRYYHIYETLLLYDYPSSLGEGRYRPDRFRSDFSLKTEVSDSIDNLIKICSKLGSNLIMSYPANGLLNNANVKILSKMKKYYSNAEIAYSIDHQHSSLGASKGVEKYPVNEILFWAR
jgi:adenine-specific DNA-methyltransferase